MSIASDTWYDITPFLGLLELVALTKTSIGTYTAARAILKKIVHQSLRIKIIRDINITLLKPFALSKEMRKYGDFVSSERGFDYIVYTTHDESLRKVLVHRVYGWDEITEGHLDENLVKKKYVNFVNDVARFKRQVIDVMYFVADFVAVPSSGESAHELVMYKYKEKKFDGKYVIIDGATFSRSIIAVDPIRTLPTYYHNYHQAVVRIVYSYDNTWDVTYFDPVKTKMFYFFV